MTRTLRLVLALVAALTLAACGGSSSSVPEGAPVESPRESINVGTDTCQTDADCFPAECCHATMCVSGQNTPMCEQIACTQECRPGSIDCGGGCLCVDGRCAARVIHRY